VIRIAITMRAYRAIRATLPLDTVVTDRERGRGRYLLSLDEDVANSLNVQRRIGESYSDVIIRLAAKGGLRL
jgi:hypothetical protein